MSYNFYADADANFRVEVLLGGVPAGLGDVGEILSVVHRTPDGADKQWAEGFAELARRVERLALEAHEAGNHTSARDAYLRAATYYAAQLEAQQYYAADQFLRETFVNHRRCWDAFADLTTPSLQRLNIGYEDTTMPGYFLSVDGTARPTVVLVNGSDGSLTWVWQEMQAAYRHGFNSLVFDGPGQQSMLFERGIGFRPDFEQVITPIVDMLHARDDVDTDALVLWGGSQGGYWVARALAFEHRFAAGCCDPGVVDVSASWLRHFPPELIDLVRAGDASDFNAAMEYGLKDPEVRGMWTFRARPYQQPTPYDVVTAMLEYNIGDVAHQIDTPLFICDPEGEQFWPGQSAQLAKLVGDKAHLQRFTTGQGADGHCEPMARSLVQQRLYDWLSTQVGLSVT